MIFTQNMTQTNRILREVWKDNGTETVMKKARMMEMLIRKRSCVETW
jgi:hypothetical protein